MTKSKFTKHFYFISSSFSHASGTIVIAASGNDRPPALIRNSSTLSKQPTIYDMDMNYTHKGLT